MKASSRKSRIAYFALGASMLAGVWVADRLLPPQANMSVFYLIPVGFVAWFCGDAPAYAMSVFAAALWLQGDLSDSKIYDTWFIPYWNAMVHLVLYVLTTALAGMIVRLRKLIEREHEISELKSDLVSLVSHEFANSLTTFKLSLTILKESDGDENSAQRQMCYATLQRVYTHLAGAVANYLNLNRIEAGRFVAHLQGTGLRTLIHATISQMGPILDEHQVKLNIDFPPHHVVVKADPDALSVIMSNLLGNAFKYTPSGGSVTVRIAQDAATARVSVEDTGIGISAADREKIVTGFYRTESGQKTAKGFGVGLKVTRELLESLDAKLEIESEPGRGSKFSFRLPLWATSRTPAE